MEEREGRLDGLIAWLLLGGSTVALFLMALGLSLMLSSGTLERPSDRSPGATLQGALALNPFDLMNLGILILMATPVVRVVALVAGFLWERQTRFALVALGVLGLLVVSAAVAAGG